MQNDHQPFLKPTKEQINRTALQAFFAITRSLAM